MDQQKVRISVLLVHHIPHATQLIFHDFFYGKVLIKIFQLNLDKMSVIKRGVVAECLQILSTYKSGWVNNNT